jgi:peptidoglycan hydrolase-like protein with peptidoglycan-binding domain
MGGGPAKTGGATTSGEPPERVDGAQKSGGAPTGTTSSGPAGATPDAATPDAATPLVSARFASDPALQACRQGQRYFRLGSSGDPVRKIQQAMLDLDYALPQYGADAHFGAETRLAVVRYQSDSALSADGIIGPNSIGTLDADMVVAPPGTTPPGTTPPGTTPPGTEPPGTEPPGTAPPGNVPPGNVPPTPETPAFASPALQAIWIAQTAGGPGRPDQRRAFEILDVNATGPWQNVPWEAVRTGAARRVFTPSLINQQTLNVCGPATIAHMKADLDPAGFATLVWEVFTTATIDGDRANEDLLANSIANRVRSEQQMAAVDWMLLSCMRDTENAVFDYEGNSSEDFSAMTMPGEMAEWMEEIIGCPETEHYTSYLWGEVSNAQTVSNLMRSHGSDVVVAILVDADAMQKTDFTFNIPTHWVRLLTPIEFQGDDHITMRVYTWGSEREYIYTEDEFEDVLFEFVVGARRPGINL